MLILSRKIQEAVVISGTSGYEQVLKVTVLEVRGGHVKLGFEAGAEVPIHRAEVWERIRAENRMREAHVITSRPTYRAPAID
jgi:carbon storage regulator CsrA